MPFHRTTYYVSSGAKNAMYTLRMALEGYGEGYTHYVDNYICNLSTDPATAQAKAEDFVSALRERYVETDTYKMEFCTEADFKLFERRGKMSVQDTQNVAMIEAGYFPFGKHKGTKLVDCPDGYALYFADKIKDPENNPSMIALCGALQGIALERGLIAKRDAVRAERHALDSLSNHIGAVGKRLDFTGEVVMSFLKRDEYGDYWINKVRCGNDLVSYVGSKSLGTVGSTITFRGTVKSHDLYNGIKSTKISRPA